MIRVERATVEHARAIGPKWRPFKGEAITLEERVEAAAKHIEASVEAWTWLDGDEPVAILGVIPRSLLGGTGSIWLLTTPAATRNARAFWRASKATVDYLAHEYARLDGFVNAEFEASIRWLGRLGFHIFYDRAFEHKGRRVFPFAMER